MRHELTYLLVGKEHKQAKAYDSACGCAAGASDQGDSGKFFSQTQVYQLLVLA